MTWIDFALEEAVKARSSVRNYADREIEPDKMEAIRRFVEALDNPFHQEVSFHWLQEDALPAGQKLGTYGVIKGTKRFIGASVRPGPLAMEALGYEMETFILYLAHLGLGSCWLGGTFNRKGFAKAMEIGEDHLFPAITPFGYGAPTRHVTEKLMRSMIQADRRSPWETLFFRDDFSSPLSREAAGDLAFPLEMLRLGLPRWVRDGDLMKTKLEAAGFEVDLQFANNDVATQVSQLENMISGGAKVLVVASIDGSALDTVLATAKEAGIPIIAYDRLLTDTKNVDYYTSFDNYKVGQIQGQYVIDKFDLSNEAVKGPFTIEFTAGSPDDNNAGLFFNGAFDLLKPYLDSGKLVCVSGQTQFEVVATPAWKSETSQARMDNILSAYYPDALTGGQKLDIALCSNDSTALGVTNSLVAAGFTKENIPVITGQDCDIPNTKNMIAGLQAMSVFKDMRLLAEQTVTMVLDILAGKTPETNAVYANRVFDVPSFNCTPVFADVNNYKELLLDSGFYTEADLAN